MPASIGVNLRVTGHCSQGGRKYMEDLFSVAYQQTEDERDLEYAFFGIYDGHGGGEAAAFAKEHLMDSIVMQRQFWSDNDEDVLKAIRNGYMLTHLNMWKEVEKWPKTVTGLPSTAGTTASIAFIRRGKIYIGHVGDSAIVLGYQKDGCEEWAAKPLTLDHKPECSTEIERIQRCGGKVISKAGVPRVVWNRPRPGHKGPIKKNTPMDEIPFLAVARSLGDLWSYNPQNDEFIVSPDPDVGVLTIDPSKFRCLIFGTDGLWNMISPEGAVSLVQATEKHNEAVLVGGGNQPRDWLNPSKSLVDHALEKWSNTRMRADNTSVVTLMLDPPGPPRATVLQSRTAQKPQTLVSPAAPSKPVGTGPKVDEAKPDPSKEGENRHVPQNGLTIMTRYSDVDKPAPSADESDRTPLPPCASIDGRFSVGAREESNNESKEDSDTILNYGNPAESYFMARLLNRTRVVNTLSEVYDEIVSGRPKESSEPREPTPVPTTALPEEKSEESRPAAGPRQSLPPEETPNTEVLGAESDDISIQINEVSSSSPTEGPLRPPPRRAAAPDPDEAARRTRSQLAARSSSGPAGNSPRAPGPARRAPAAPARSKENRGAATRRARARAARASPSPPSRLPRTRRADNEPEVHSTTADREARALRSRNEAAGEASAGPGAGAGAAGAKRPRLEDGKGKCARALGKRASGPWAPALALRNRLRRRLVK
ncbi:probable protein phosphatase 2C 71 [Zerene cesonia]|uniref:probable protein phosphatase 2C 71 n=1 Tax=Zerene cesonia TaxID=33412 RepID=UPI0018E5063D|nr:probable protein phosphatase 2C 71 [Zerene cesonia]